VLTLWTAEKELAESVVTGSHQAELTVRPVEPVKPEPKVSVQEAVQEEPDTGCGPDAKPGQVMGNRYRVGECEYIGKIAQAHGILIRDLIAANPQIKDPDRIKPGEILNLPARR